MTCKKCSKESLAAVKNTRGATTMETANKIGKYYVKNSGATYEMILKDEIVTLCYTCMKKHQNQQNVRLNELREEGKTTFNREDYKLKLDEF